MIKIILILIALTAPMVPGCLAIGVLLPEIKKQKIVFCLFGLLAGHSLLSSVTFVLHLAGFKITLGLFLIVFTALSALFYFLRKKLLRNSQKNKRSEWTPSIDTQERNGKRGQLPNKRQAKAVTLQKRNAGLRSIFFFLSAISLIYLFIVIITSMTESVSDWPGIGVWGLKAKIIYYTDSCSDLLTNREIAFSHPEYPLGYALMITWCCKIMGEFDNYLIKIIPIFWGTLTFLLIFNIAKTVSNRKNTALLLTLFAASTTTYINCCIKMYAEMILISLVLAGFYCLDRFFKCRSAEISEKTRWLLTGFVLLIFSCGYKTEGLLYLTTAFLWLAIFAFRDIKIVFKQERKLMLYVLIITLIITLFPCLFTKYQYGLHTRDFSFSKSVFFTLSPFSPEWEKIFFEISSKFYHEYLFNKYNLGMCCAFMLLTSLLFLSKNFFKLSNIKKHVSQYRSVYFIIVCALSVAIIFYLSFFASIMPLWWHLQAVKRILLLPNLLICLALFHFSSKFFQNSTVNSSQNPSFCYHMEQ